MPYLIFDLLLVSVRFVGGKLNMCYNAVDRHVENGRGEQPAIIYDSPVTGIKQIITFKELQDQVEVTEFNSIKSWVKARLGLPGWIVRHASHLWLDCEC